MSCTEWCSRDLSGCNQSQSLNNGNQSFFNEIYLVKKKKLKIAWEGRDKKSENNPKKHTKHSIPVMKSATELFNLHFQSDA